VGGVMMEKLQLRWDVESCAPSEETLTCWGRRGRITFCKIAIHRAYDRARVLRDEALPLNEYTDWAEVESVSWMTLDEAEALCQKAFEAYLGEIMAMEAP